MLDMLLYTELGQETDCLVADILIKGHIEG